MNELQIQLEKDFAKIHQDDYLWDALEPFAAYFTEAALRLELHIQLWDYDYEVDGIQRVRKDLLELRDYFNKVEISSVFRTLAGMVTLQQEVTLQCAVGCILKAFKGISTVSRQLKAANLVLEFCPLIELDIRPGEYYSYVRALAELDHDELIGAKQRSYVPLPSIVPLRIVKSNSQSGYHTHDKSVLLGNKHHEKEINLAHINRCNAVAFQLDRNILDCIAKLNVFDAEPKFNKKTSRLETRMEIAKRKEAWLNLNEGLQERLDLLGNSPLYFNHEYDNRGRTYAEAYHVQYQGASMQKSLVNLYHKETIPAEW